MEIIFLCILIIVFLILDGYIIYKDVIESRRRFEIQIASATASKTPDISKLKYEELINIVDIVIAQHIKNNLSIASLEKADTDIVGLEFDNLLAETCASIKISISKEVKECLKCYVSEDFFDKYIFNNVRLLMMNIVGKRR